MHDAVMPLNVMGLESGKGDNVAINLTLAGKATAPHKKQAPPFNAQFTGNMLNIIDVISFSFNAAKPAIK